MYSYYSPILSLANLSNNYFCPKSLKKIVAFIYDLFHSKFITSPNPKRKCSTSIPTCKVDVFEGSNPADGTCALGKIEVVLITFSFGFEKESSCPFRCQFKRSELNSSPPVRV